MTGLAPLPQSVLPSGIRSRFVGGINGLRMHVLESGYETRGRPLVLLLHGFPELAYSWRKVMLPLADAGFHVVAPDQRGYGRTTGWHAEYDGDLGSFRILNAVRDAFGLVSALGYRDVAMVAGHDFGASVAAWCALVRPDVFRSVALMSAPFAGPPEVPFETADNPPPKLSGGGHSRGISQAGAPPQALPMVLFDPARQLRQVEVRAGCPCFPARVFPLQERRLAGEQTVPFEILDRR
jgi:pimeloyl-ACP methyl ester carboxylesterase